MRGPGRRHPEFDVLFKRCCLIAVGFVVLLTGCQQDEIRAFRPPKLPPGQAEQGTYRLVAAVFPRPEQTWFIKVAGPVERVFELREDFDAFVRSIRFPGGKIEWTAPAGWAEEKGKSGGIRTATFRVGPKKQALEVTIVDLPNEAKEAASLLANVNRWRDQLGLKAITEDGLKDDLNQIIRKVQVDNVAATVVEITGPGKLPPPRVPFKFTLPEGWTQAKEAVKFSELTLRVIDGDDVAQMTVTRLGGGGLLENVNRWRGQVELDDIKPEQLKKDVKTVTISDIDAPYVNLEGKKKTILGAILTRPEGTWYFKMIGPVELIKREEPKFKAFLGSIRFEAREKKDE